MELRGASTKERGRVQGADSSLLRYRPLLAEFSLDHKREQRRRRRDLGRREEKTRRVTGLREDDPFSNGETVKSNEINAPLRSDPLRAVQIL